MKTVKKSIVCIALCMSLLIFGAWTYDAQAAEIRYADAPLLSTYATETIAYVNKTTDKNSTVNNAPEYNAISGLSNACGAVAGSIVVGFYDKYFPDLIDGWNSYFPNGKYRGQDAVYVSAVMNELYTLMRTNVDDVGVSRSDCINGLKKYINNRGYAVNYTSVATDKSINYEACKSAIDSNNLIILFSCPCSVYSIANTDGSDIVVSANISGNHIMVAYGYEEIKYYNASGLFRTDRYLKVKTGLSTMSDMLYKISPHKLEAAYAVTIS